MAEKFITKQEAIDGILALMRRYNMPFFKFYEEIGMAYDEPDGGGLMATCVTNNRGELEIENCKAGEFDLESLQRAYKEIGRMLFQATHGDFRRHYLNMRVGISNILKEMAPGQKVRLSGSECPRIRIADKWHDIILVDIPEDDKLALRVGWHSDSCTGKGVNSIMNLSNCPMETQVEIWEIICRRFNNE